jgi:hypothetical protein
MSLRKMPLVAGIAGALLLMLLAGQALGSRTRIVRLAGREGIIFGPREAAEIMGSTLSEQGDDYWAPSRRDVVAVERHIGARILSEHPGHSSEFARYGRQYYGFVRRGERHILVVGFCLGTSVDWTREFVPVQESGCHFEAEYNVTTDRLGRFWTSSD